jgi:hypothetical protein
MPLPSVTRQAQRRGKPTVRAPTLCAPRSPAVCRFGEESMATVSGPTASISSTQRVGSRARNLVSGLQTMDPNGPARAGRRTDHHGWALQGPTTCRSANGQPTQTIEPARPVESSDGCLQRDRRISGPPAALRESSERAPRETASGPVGAKRAPCDYRISKFVITINM